MISGIPFWTSKPVQPGTPPASNRGRSGVRFAGGEGAKALAGMSDFFLFKETNDQVITEGFFNNDWKLPADALQKIKDSGVVEAK